MKKLITTALFAALSLVSLLAGDMMDGAMMKDGKMMVTKDGKSMIMEKDMTLTDGTKVMTDGKVMTPNGKVVMMKNGEMITMEGKIMEHGKNEVAGDKTMQ